MAGTDLLMRDPYRKRKRVQGRFRSSLSPVGQPQRWRDAHGGAHGRAVARHAAEPRPAILVVLIVLVDVIVVVAVALQALFVVHAAADVRGVAIRILCANTAATGTRGRREKGMGEEAPRKNRKGTKTQSGSREINLRNSGGRSASLQE
jgi:hypothetical protein